MAKRLIINADDLGHPDGSVPAITALYEAGVVTSTTAMTNQPNWPEAAAYLRDHPGLGAGVHLVMNEGMPVLPVEQVRSLVNAQGRFRDGSALPQRYGRLRLRELEAEWRAQIEKFSADTGRRPDHLDLHCYYPHVFLVPREPAAGRGVRPSSRAHAVRRRAGAQGGGYGRQPWLPRLVRALTGPALPAHGAAVWPQAPQLLRVILSLFVPDERQRTAEYLLGLLETFLEGITELVIHPGTVDWRERDYRALADSRVKERIRELGIELVTFSALGQ